MKSKSKLFGILLLTPCSPALAAYQNYPVRSQTAIIEDGREFFAPRLTPTSFRMELLSDADGVKAETVENGRTVVTARKGETYSIRIYNPLPVRAAANLTVDGLNSISGKPEGISDGSKWMIEPYSSVVIRGWQVNGAESRRFFFTDKPKSYAKWRGDATGRNLSANCGVIGVAFFWNQSELDRYYAEHPIYRYARVQSQLWDNRDIGAPAAALGGAAEGAAAGFSNDRIMAKKAAAQQAGTGMGERESNPTTMVEFKYDTGMYQASQALLVYYDFASPEPEPNPFPGLSYAPEMPDRM